MKDIGFFWYPFLRDVIPLNEAQFNTRKKFFLFKEHTLSYKNESQKFFQFDIGGISRRIDPTYDKIDLEDDDFIYYLTKLKFSANNDSGKSFGM